MSRIKLVGAKDGPFLLSPVENFIDESGETRAVQGHTMALCRCGHSRNKPFCDGSHRKANFEAPAVSLDLEV